MIELPHSRSCFVCGAHNPIGLKLRFYSDGERVETRFTPSMIHNGFINVIHGGLLATLLDEVMVWACGVKTKQFSYCAEMTVRYHSPGRPNEEIVARGEIVENRRRMFTARGELFGPGERLIAASTGKYMPVKDMSFASILEDFEGSAEQLRSFFG